MSDKVFYSWQSDLSNSTNRGFIQSALEKAAKAIREDDSIEVEPVIDRDTAGVPGSPDIVTTIFEKIEQAQVFVCDISIINHASQEARPTPNPNVLLELGYAIKALGTKRILMVMNGAFGEPKLLPFDLGLKRVTTYHMREVLEENEDRATERNRLAGIFEGGLRTIFDGLNKPLPGEIIQPISLGKTAIEAVENSSANQVYRVRKYMEWLTQEIGTLNAIFLQGPESEIYEKFLQAAKQSEKMALEFAQLSQVVADLNSSDAASAIYKGFEEIIKGYDVQPPFVGSTIIHNYHYDLYKFIGHELFVTFFSFLIRSRCWDIIANLLEESFYIYNISKGQKEECAFTHVNQYAYGLGGVSRKLNRYSVHSDLLQERHTVGLLTELVPMEQFIDADYFLFLRAEVQEAQCKRWTPWSLLYMRGHIPTYLLEATRKKNAEKLLKPLGVEGNIEALRVKLVNSSEAIARQFQNAYDLNVLGTFDLNSIGTR